MSFSHLTDELAGLASRLEMLEEDIRKSKRDAKTRTAPDTAQDDAAVTHAELRTKVTTLRMDMFRLQETVALIGRRVMRLEANVEHLALAES